MVGLAFLDPFPCLLLHQISSKQDVGAEYPRTPSLRYSIFPSLYLYSISTNPFSINYPMHDRKQGTRPLAPEEARDACEAAEGGGGGEEEPRRLRALRIPQCPAAAWQLRGAVGGRGQGQGQRKGRGRGR
jgi:hypothetical protein